MILKETKNQPSSSIKPRSPPRPWSRGQAVNGYVVLSQQTPNPKRRTTVAFMVRGPLHDLNNNVGEPWQGSRTVKGTIIYQPARGTHPPRSGGPRIPSQGADHYMSHKKAHGCQEEPTKLRHQTMEPTMNRGIEDGPWMGSLS
ncbi:hypothetical protein MTR67_023211 [Solanum verrucosum]|uniref:Uncharacterized protein n=1 Tax=Solanum verrucosum TaxID=315347 RepID=A0AAF0TRM2_SOLVR|nr:hypothetical protein MTR67_023211 [Solanum verrucosum]